MQDVDISFRKHILFSSRLMRHMRIDPFACCAACKKNEPLLHPFRHHQHEQRIACHGHWLHGPQLLHLHRLCHRQLLHLQVCCSGITLRLAVAGSHRKSTFAGECLCLPVGREQLETVTLRRGQKVLFWLGCLCIRVVKITFTQVDGGKAPRK